MIRTIIIDDEQQARSALKYEIGLHCPEVQLIGEATNVAEGIEILKKEKPELILLDIRLSDGFGFDILEGSELPGLKVIITSAYSEYALKAIKISAVDYLLKPVDATDLKVAISKIVNYQNKKTTQQDSAQLYDQQHKITIQTSEGIYIIQISDIISCSSYGNYCFINCNGNKKILVSKTLKEMETQLESFGFERIHHSYIVNLNHVTTYKNKNGTSVQMNDGSEIPVSVRKRAKLLVHLHKLNL